MIRSSNMRLPESCLFVPLSAFTLLAPDITLGQSVCSQPPDDAILTICERESGMVPMPQPQLQLRVYSDGRSEYETRGGLNGLTLNKTKITDTQLNDLLDLGRSPDFQRATEVYPVFQHKDDSSSLITVTFRNGENQKRITLANFYARDPQNKLRYPPPLVGLIKLADDIREKAMGIVRPVPTITFCELIKNHDQYFGEKVAIYATLEYHASVMANLKVVNERATLNDPECDSLETGDPRTREVIGVSYLGTDGEVEGLKGQVRRLSDFRFNGRARVLATGFLINERQRALDTYNYTFNLVALKDIQPIVLPYKGKLELGWMYSDTFDYVKANGIQLSSPLKPLPHQASRIEWRGENNFPALKTDGRKHIVFRVNSSVTQQMTSNRWDVTYNCEILEVK